MNYEEYKDRMVAQKRKPVEPEHYEDCVERAYMALEDVDKDEFCRLSGKAIAAITKLAKERDRSVVRVEDLAAVVARQTADLNDAEKQLNGYAEHVAELQRKVSRRDALIRDMAVKLGMENLIDMLLDYPVSTR